MTGGRVRAFGWGLALPLAVVLAGIAAPLLVQVLGLMALCAGKVVYALDAAYVHLALAQQIIAGNYGIVPGEAAAPSSTILYPFLLAALDPLGLGSALPLVINVLCTVAAGLFAMLLARECDIALERIPPLRLFVLTVTVTLALNLPGLAITGLEHSLHVAMTVAYLLGLVRFVKNGRCDWWWIACIIIQPIIRFEAAAMVVADALIFVFFRKYRYALAMVAIGVFLVGGYSLFLHSLGLPLLPSSVLARSEWSKAAVASDGGGGVLPVLFAILRNVKSNATSFGAAQMLGTLAAAVVWLGAAGTRLWAETGTKSDRIKLVTLAFMAFVTIAQLTGGKLGWEPPRYEAYVLVLNMCGLAVIFREQVNAWCEHATWPRVSAICLALLLVFAGYVVQFVSIPVSARKEYLGSFQLQRFVTEFYHRPVAVNQLGYVNYRNPDYVLDLSGLGSEAARRAQAAQEGPDWMNAFLASHNIDLAIMDSGTPTAVPESWVRLADLYPGGSPADPTARYFTFYARSAGAAGPAAEALARFARTLPPADRLLHQRPAVS
ncbi:MAG: hypothetical protein JOZ42_10800 [Acetobacteraceae bacterium]|nr:hypothetical protein [Acetobacteraceae bacterium]